MVVAISLFPIVLVATQLLARSWLLLTERACDCCDPCDLGLTFHLTLTTSDDAARRGGSLSQLRGTRWPDNSRAAARAQSLSQLIFT